MGKPRSSIRETAQPVSVKEQAKAITGIAKDIVDAAATGKIDEKKVTDAVKKSGLGRTAIIPLYADQVASVARSIVIAAVPPVTALPPAVTAAAVGVTAVAPPPPLIPINCTVKVVEYSTNSNIARKTVYYGGKKFNPTKVGRWIQLADWALWPNAPWEDIPAGEPFPGTANMLYTTTQRTPPAGYVCEGVAAYTGPAPIMSQVSVSAPIITARTPPPPPRPSPPAGRPPVRPVTSTRVYTTVGGFQELQEFIRR